MRTYTSSKLFMPIIGMLGLLTINLSHAAVLTLSATDDVMLIGTTGGSPDGNYGSNKSLWVQSNGESALTTSLLRFDLSSLPADAAVTSVVLKLYLTTAHATISSWVGVFALSPSNYGWVENISTYNNMLGGTPWPAGSAGAVTTPFGATNPSLLTYKEFRNAVSFTPVNNYYAFSDIYNASVFSAWDAHGYAEILLESLAYTIPRAVFSSSDEGASFAPLLEINYTIIPEPGTIGLVLLSSLLVVYVLRQRRVRRSAHCS